MVGHVTSGQVCIILAHAATHLSPHDSAGNPLLDLCGYMGCLSADLDALDDPSTVNGRRRLGLKGNLSEWELHTIRTRMTAGLLNKAVRGDLEVTLLTGLKRDAQGQLRKVVNGEIQARPMLGLTTFLRRQSASKLLEFSMHTASASRGTSALGDEMETPYRSSDSLYPAAPRICRRLSLLDGRARCVPA